ncbi:hypothetical protein ACFTXM_09660 [Streptomyces sp. NPDC056930]|uniref:hypothetical protein n=1 Tax=Streptomyces sp. NPDC056930 TaxID=3345967 RepID=UPI00363098B2
MATYKLSNGYRVRTTGQANGSTEFHTRNSEGETVSTVTLPLEQAMDLVTVLRINDALRFAQTYGGGVR